MQPTNSPLAAAGGTGGAEGTGKQGVVSAEHPGLLDKVVYDADRAAATRGARATPGADDPLPIRAGTHGGVRSEGSVRTGSGTTATSDDASGDALERVADGDSRWRARGGAGTGLPRGEGVMKVVAVYARVSS